MVADFWCTCTEVVVGVLGCTAAAYIVFDTLLSEAAVVEDVCSETMEAPSVEVPVEAVAK